MTKRENYPCAHDWNYTDRTAGKAGRRDCRWCRMRQLWQRGKWMTVQKARPVAKHLQMPPRQRLQLRGGEGLQDPLRPLRRSRRAAGVRLTEEQAAAETGALTEEQLTFVLAVAEYQQKYRLKFLRWTQVLEVVKDLGYHRHE